MQSVRRIEKVDRSGLLTLRLPEFTGIEVDITIVPRIKGLSAEALGTLRLQETSGFASKVLADPVEDVWNDL